MVTTIPYLVLYIALKISNITQKAVVHIRVGLCKVTTYNAISGALYSVGNFQHYLEGCCSSQSQIAYGCNLQHPIWCSIQRWKCSTLPRRLLFISELDNIWLQLTTPYLALYIAFPTVPRRLLFISELDYVWLQLTTPYLVLSIALEISNSTQKAVVYLRVRLHMVTTYNTLSGALYSVGNFQQCLEGCCSYQSQIT